MKINEIRKQINEELDQLEDRDYHFNNNMTRTENKIQRLSYFIR